MAIIEIEKFDEKGDFALWKAKIKALLGQQKTHKAHGTLILNLSNNVVRQVLEEETPYKIWRNVDGWLHHVECYFVVNRLTERDKLVATVLCLEEEALDWYQWKEDRRSFCGQDSSRSTREINT